MRQLRPLNKTPLRPVCPFGRVRAWTDALRQVFRVGGLEPAAKYIRFIDFAWEL